LSAGVGVTLSIEAVDAECDAIGLSRDSSTHDSALSLANEWGIPLAGVVMAQAQMLRQSAVALVRVRAKEMAERLLLPLAACILPAFVLLSIVPIVAGLLEQSGLRWSA
jgi:tight adherence protein B